MIVTAEGKTVSLGIDLADAVVMKHGREVRLHAMPDWVFRVSDAVADTIDQAQAAVVKAVRAERKLPNTGATIQRF